MSFLQLTRVLCLLNAATSETFLILSMQGFGDSMKTVYDRAYITASLNATKALDEIGFL